MSTYLFAFALLATVPEPEFNVAPTNKCPKLEKSLSKWMHAYRVKMRRPHDPRIDLLAQRIVAEAKRHKLDPIVLATVAWIESDYTFRPRSPRGEQGLWQLVPWDSSIRKSAKKNYGCLPPAQAPAWQRKAWPRRFKRYRCDAPDVGKRRRTTGHWSYSELRDVYISTYVAADHLRRHITASTHVRRWGLRSLSGYQRGLMVKYPDYDWMTLERACHYNWGTRYLPKRVTAWAYRAKMFHRFVKIREAACK